MVVPNRKNMKESQKKGISQLLSTGILFTSFFLSLPPIEYDFKCIKFHTWFAFPSKSVWVCVYGGEKESACSWDIPGERERGGGVQGGASGRSRLKLQLTLFEFPLTSFQKHRNAKANLKSDKMSWSLHSVEWELILVSVPIIGSVAVCSKRPQMKDS